MNVSSLSQNTLPDTPAPVEIQSELDVHGQISMGAQLWDAELLVLLFLFYQGFLHFNENALIIWCSTASRSSNSSVM